jgi:hypothetical protein
MYLVEQANELHAIAKKYFQWMVSPKLPGGGDPINC